MPLLVPNAAEAEMLRDILSQEHILHLFVNDRDPDPKDTLNSYTEATGAGYAALGLSPNDWQISGGATKDMPTEATHPETVFSFTAALGDVYGYFVTRGGRLRWAERFPDAPVKVTGSNIRIKIVPNLTLE